MEGPWAAGGVRRDGAGNHAPLVVPCRQNPGWKGLVKEESTMALEETHLDVLQNIEFAIVSVYRKQRALRDVEVMRALDALIDVYRAEARGHTPKEISLPDPERLVFQRTKEMCDLRLGRHEVVTRIHVPFEGEKTVS